MDSHYRSDAVGALAERDYRAAGDAYSRAAWQTLAEPREGHSPFDADEKGWIGRALQLLVLAGVSYRVAGLPERATHRAVEGAAITRDLTSALEGPAQVACLREFAADLRVVGGLDGVADAYDDAETAYETAGDGIEEPQSVATTPLLQAAALPIQQVARGLDDGEIAVSWSDLHGTDSADAGRFLGHRAAFKRQRFPSLLDRCVEAGYLAAHRGTTEYDNANVRCPACGSADVNWAADHTLCLRCSTPMAQR